jgi:hypothetical protein
MFYLCWRPDISTVFEVYKDEKALSLALDIVKETYCGAKQRRPVKLPEDLPYMKVLIESGSLKSKFLGEFPSVIVSDSAVLHECSRKLVKDAKDVCK